ncbi:MAG TPA: ABC transporter ATP-binding protein [Alphaproteobacteria bacterium]|nr:ABC transporter ATP-binding protein [Alphaproteobacteria bacterium]
MAAALEVRNLRTQFLGPNGYITVVDGVNLELAQGETLAIVGESGSGKSVTAMSILRVLPEPPARIDAGQVLLDGRDLLTLDEDAMRAVRGHQISMIFQEPMTSLNPVMTVGDQIVEALCEHRDISNKEAFEEAVALLERVRIPDARRRAVEYPHRLSGGMRQRVMIAMALACRPQILIADEPTTALDVTVQAQILALLAKLQSEFGMGILLITHNLGVVARVAQRVIVMYAGRVVEEAPVGPLFKDPLHPYTEGLLGATPRMHADAEEGARQRLVDIPGTVPLPDKLPAGCAFAPRCPKAFDRCVKERPALVTNRDGRKTACFLTQEAS